MASRAGVVGHGVASLLDATGVTWQTGSAATAGSGGMDCDGDTLVADLLGRVLAKDVDAAVEAIAVGPAGADGVSGCSVANPVVRTNSVAAAGGASGDEGKSWPGTEIVAAVASSGSCNGASPTANLVGHPANAAGHARGSLAAPM